MSLVVGVGECECCVIGCSCWGSVSVVSLVVGVGECECCVIGCSCWVNVSVVPLVVGVGGVSVVSLVVGVGGGVSVVSLVIQTCSPSVFFRICYGIQPRIRKYGFVNLVTETLIS